MNAAASALDDVLLRSTFSLFFHVFKAIRFQSQFFSLSSQIWNVVGCAGGGRVSPEFIFSVI